VFLAGEGLAPSKAVKTSLLIRVAFTFSDCRYRMIQNWSADTRQGEQSSGCQHIVADVGAVTVACVQDAQREPSRTSPRIAMRSEAGYGSGRSNTPSTMEKIAVVTPIPFIVIPCFQSYPPNHGSAANAAAAS
jgi:hypothetical protein